jgi:energy-coupling factor transport system permease protein
MNLSLYQDHDTWLHRLDPRTKLAGLFAIFALSLCFNHPLYVAVVTAAVLLLIAAARAQGGLRTLRFLLILLVGFSMGLWPFFVKGPTPLWRWHALEISRESLLFGIAMGLRLANFVMAGLLLLATTRNEELNAGFLRMGLPYPAAFALATALRLVPTFAGAGATIIQAQVSRGLDLDSKNLLARFGKFLPLAVPLFISAIRYTNQLAMALEARGFSPGAPRTLYREPRMGRSDYWTLVLLACLLALFLTLRLAMGVGVLIPGRL